MVKIKVEVVNLSDVGTGSVSGDYYQTRQLLEHMLEYVRLKDDIETSPLSSEGQEIQELGLPLQFASSGKKGKKKRKFLETCCVPESAVQQPKEAVAILAAIDTKVQNWSTAAFYLRDNIGTVREKNCENTQIVVIRGQGHDSEYCVVKNIFSGHIFLVHRMTELRPIPTDELIGVYDQVNAFVRYEMIKGKPADVHEKYWDQRYRIFSRFDQGIRLDAESWYSVTYESIGEAIADTCLKVSRAKSIPIHTVWDGFSGCGGTGISFCRRGFYVTAIDICGVKLRHFR